MESLSYVNVWMYHLTTKHEYKKYIYFTQVQNHKVFVKLSNIFVHIELS